MPRKQELPDHAVNITPSIMGRAIVARATHHDPAYPLRIANETGLSPGAASAMINDMKTAGLAQHGERAKILPSGRAADPSVGTEILQQEVHADVHLSRAVLLLALAERIGCSPGEALDRALALGHIAVDAQEPSVVERQSVLPQA